MQLLEQMGLLVRRWGTYLRIREELGTYTDRELNDMGMSRADIGRIAREAASLVKADPTRAANRRPALLRQRFSPYL
jgi:uncharacterized protein YjiS (DUF1127 family)